MQPGPAVDEFGRAIQRPKHSEHHHQQQQLVPAHVIHQRHKSFRHPCERYLDAHTLPIPCFVEFKHLSKHHPQLISNANKSALDRPLDAARSSEPAADAHKDDNDNTESKELSDEEYQAQYQEYLQGICKSYMENYLNTHLDDPFFIELYSPLVLHRKQEQASQLKLDEVGNLIGELNAIGENDELKKQVNLSIGQGESLLLSAPLMHLHSHERVSQMLLLKDCPGKFTDSILQKHVAQLLYDLFEDDDHEFEVNCFSAPFPMDRPVYRNVLLLIKCTEEQIQLFLKRRPMNYGHPTIEIEERFVPIFTLTAAQSRTSTLPPSLSKMSPQRVQKFQNLAVMIARALDVKYKLSKGIDDVLNIKEDADDVTLLDLAIAYLRRVHYFSFYYAKLYDFTHLLENESEITLYLRDAAAAAESPASNGIDEANTTTTDEAAATTTDYYKEDILVQNVESSLTEFLEKLTDAPLPSSNNNNHHLLQLPNLQYVDKVTIEEMLAKEEEIKAEWVEEHCIKDEGRARCGFESCRKLFKSKNFLQKHLLKKHVEDLQQKQVQVHDPYIMANWESDQFRPTLPPLIVDCGERFGTKEVRVTGGNMPTLIDPEPAMRKKWEEEEQRREEEYARREELRQKKRKVYVDVDDMEEKKVELNFGAVEGGDGEGSAGIGFPVKKKKKKKL